MESEESGLRKNVEALVSIVLFAFLVFASLYFIGVEKKRATIIRESGTISEDVGTQVGGGNEMKVSQQRRFSGLLVSRPVSYYNLLLRRNPFAPLPAFEPGARPEHLVLIRPPSRSDDGDWVAQIQNRITGEIHVKRERERIAGILIKKIERGRVVISWQGEDIVLKPLLTDVELDLALALVRRPSLSREGVLVARIKDVKTGKMYVVREGDEIEGMFTVKIVEAERVVLGREGKDDIELIPPVRPPTFDLVFRGTIKIVDKFIAQIENLRTGESYFVEEGETIAEVYTVKKISQSRVILGREGKEDMVLEL